MLCRQRDLVLVPVPFSDLARRKVRPVVVLSNDRYNREGPDILVAGVTSNVLLRPFSVELDTAQLEEGKMPRRSMVRADKVYSLDQAIVMRRVGRVSAETFARIREQVDALLAVAP